MTSWAKRVARRFRTLVPALRRELEFDAVVANADNSASTGRGIVSNI
ncbi:MAG: hypothetical protein M3305_08210 [Actinomycetota bacterium]|nr:hypothetical protein [Actinomycetota bacterium]